MYFIVTDHGVLRDQNLKSLCNKNHIMPEQCEFKPVGPDFVFIATDKDLDFLQDKARLSNIMFGKFFDKGPNVFLFVMINLILNILILVLK